MYSALGDITRRRGGIEWSGQQHFEVTAQWSGIFLYYYYWYFIDFSHHAIFGSIMFIFVRFILKMSRQNV